MPDLTKSNIGYFIASFGALLILLTLFLLYHGELNTTDGKGILIALIISGMLLVGLGMYAVVPSASHDFVSDVGGVARDIVPRWGNRRDQAPPVDVSPAAGQSAVVHPPSGPAVAVSPTGETQQLPPSAPAPAPDPEVATGAALPLRSFAAPQRSLEEPPPGTLPTRDAVEAQWANEVEETQRPTVKRVGAKKIGEAQQKRQDLYPPGDA